jgi:hypothetical protein
MAELVAKEPLFRGKNEIDQLGKVFLLSFSCYMFYIFFFWVIPVIQLVKCADFSNSWHTK